MPTRNDLRRRRWSTTPNKHAAAAITEAAAATPNNFNALSSAPWRANVLQASDISTFAPSTKKVIPTATPTTEKAPHSHPDRNQLTRPFSTESHSGR
jgi:hypothetical protein